MTRDTKMKRFLLVCAACAALGVVSASRLTAGAGAARMVYFSAVDEKGVPVSDLTPADLAVKEGGKDQKIDTLMPATTPLDAVLIVDDGGSGAFQGAVAQFLETTQNKAQVSLTALEPQPMKVMDFTKDFDEFRKAVARVGPRGRITTVGEQIMGTVESVSKDLRKRQSARAAIVVMTVGGEPPQSTEADPALNALKASGASLSVVHLMGVELGKVLGDGPRRSGGVSQQVSSGVPIGPVLTKIAQGLLGQYLLTYTLPDGVKPNERFALTTTRKGLTLLAPTRIPDK